MIKYDVESCRQSDKDMIWYLTLKVAFLMNSSLSNIALKSSLKTKGMLKRQVLARTTKTSTSNFFLICHRSY